MSVDPSEGRIQGIGPFKGLLLLFGLRRIMTQMRKADPPVGMILNDRAFAVVDKAQELARSGREDPAAVAEIQKVAGHRRHAVSDAALSLQSENRHLEIRATNRAFRLLQAAKAGGAVAPEDSSLSARFDAVDQLLGLSRKAAFAELVAREPRLLTVRATAYTQAAEIESMTLAEKQDLVRDHQRVSAELAPLVGPERTYEDLLLSTNVALGLATFGLRRRPPLSEQVVEPIN
jgi:hypothetical protein